MIPVTSSVLAAVDYDAATSAMTVELRSGTVYRYDNVPRTVFDALLAAPSKGTFYNQVVKKFTYEKLR